ncbi:MAG TPA: discoidin domain-containing protein, partial [Mucilaginibacter sp.]|nr:discoidin domain-containing protein [Mucilaginibacter sp.]
LLFILIFLSAYAANAQQYTRGIGVYPGDPKEYFGPSMRIDAAHYRNLALHRAAYQSSSYDYNLTAQLITDGIVSNKLPGWLVVSTSGSGILPRDGREHVLDRHASSQEHFRGPDVWVQVQMAGDYEVPPVDSISIDGGMTVDTLIMKTWTVTVSGSDDGVKWDELGKASGDKLPGIDALTSFMKRFRMPGGQKPTPEQMVFMRRFFPPNRRVMNFDFKLPHEVHYKYYRFEGNDPGAKNWSVNDIYLCDKGKTAPVGGPYHFSSAWKSMGSGTEWVYVDLGARCSFDDVKLDWIRPAVQGSIQVSDDANHWTDIAPLPANPAEMTDIPLHKMVKGRYVRVLMTKPANANDGYILSEMEVMGTGGPMPVAHPPAALLQNSELDLAGGAWKLQRSSLVSAGGDLLSKPGFNDSKWMVATVPGTSLTSYVNDGAVPEPNYGDNNVMISDSYFYGDFWYRDVFTAPASYKGKHTFLNFDGINWEAEVYLNGHSLGRINGAFIRGKFDVTDLLIPGAKNVLAVRILKNETPGFPTEQNRNSTDANGGELGGDNPTFHASIGWDWIPTIRGRNTGIWNKVYLSATGPVTVENPLITTKLPLPDTSSADVYLEVTLKNHTGKTVKGRLQGRFGNIDFTHPVSLAPSADTTIKLDASSTPALRLKHPMLWWPNGYGKQNLYTVSLAFVLPKGIVSDTKTFKTGVREMTYTDTGNLKIWVNGRRFIPRGGNMGFAEDLLRYRSREYNIAVGFHKDMNLNMIRDWVGQVDDEAFYNACDKYGIMIWQDFWLANPSDGPDPYNPGMFIANMKDYVKRIRNHPSIALFVGRNEGNPPPEIEKAITTSLPVLAPGIKYIPNSAFGSVSGGGFYSLQPLKSYFRLRATPKFHSEMGMPDLMSYESFKRTMPDSSIWPQSRMWGVHDFTLEGAQRGQTFNKTIEDSFGKIDDVKKWLSLAAWTEYQGYRAMYEAQSKNRMGLLVWMTHPSWPSLVWQSYDYYFEPTGAYFGAKKASEPLHIQWNPLTDSVEVVNYSIPDGKGLTAKLKVLDMNGSVKFSKEVTLSCPIDSRSEVMKVDIPAGLNGAYFVRLELDRGNKVISRNSYCRGANMDAAGGIGDLKAIADLPQVKLHTSTQVIRKGSQWILTTKLTNDTQHPAFNVRLKVTGEKSGKRILPVIYQDNYFTLLPGESRTIISKAKNEDARGEKPAMVVEGFNVQP